MNFPSFLIVVPTLDSHHLLPRLLSSLQRQIYPQWRLIFIDGPSGLSHRNWLIQCCIDEPRCSWVSQSSDHPGIFGAMNQGFVFARPEEWMLFWGSDDCAASSTVLADLADVVGTAAINNNVPDLFVSRGRYMDAVSGSLLRFTSFKSRGVLDTVMYRRALLFGSTPPHQATLFGPGARRRLSCYSSNFSLSADLDYFLRLSRQPELCVQCLDLVLVHMADGGVSGQQTQRRVQEVRRAYCSAFGWYWWFPFLMRYLRRVSSVLNMYF
tara:strand:+ start:4126 stop:4929 length:804 start_codon:yes stop_codon:yes gene_type:complete